MNCPCCQQSSMCAHYVLQGVHRNECIFIQAKRNLTIWEKRSQPPLKFKPTCSVTEGYTSTKIEESTCTCIILLYVKWRAIHGSKLKLNNKYLSFRNTL